MDETMSQKDRHMKTINIDGVEYVKKSDIPKIGIPDGDKSNPFFIVGRDYLIRTVTHYYTGRLVWVGDKEIVIEDATWVADTGRFNENEVEPYPKGMFIIVGRGSISNMSERI